MAALAFWFGGGRGLCGPIPCSNIPWRSGPDLLGMRQGRLGNCARNGSTQPASFLTRRLATTWTLQRSEPDSDSDSDSDSESDSESESESESESTSGVRRSCRGAVDV